MDLTKTYTQGDIDLMISSNQEENIHLDFKASGSLQNKDANKKEISKDVSSFANSDGGIIIYGITEKNYKADSIDAIDGNLITKEWLEQVITSNIDPRIQDIVIDVIRYNDEISKTIYVVKIPRATKAHMANDNRYYKRFNFSSEKMEEYEVQDLYFRKNSADLDILKPKNTNAYIQGSTGGRPSSIAISFELNITNNSVTPESLYKYEFFINSYVYLRCFSFPNAENIQQRTLMSVGYFYSFSPTTPVFKDEISNICKFEFVMNEMNCNVPWDIEIKLYSSSGYKEAKYDLLDLFLVDGKRANELFRY
jgi:hypothetical protein